MNEQETVRAFLASVSVGEPLCFEQLALYPLSRKEAAPFQCITLDEAMARGSFQVGFRIGMLFSLLSVKASWFDSAGKDPNAVLLNAPLRNWQGRQLHNLTTPTMRRRYRSDHGLQRFRYKLGTSLLTAIGLA